MKTGTFTVPTDLLNRIKAAQNILCISHVNADGDAYGSVLGMVWMLRSLGKRATAAMPDPVLPDFGFLPGAGEIVGPDDTADDYDLIICLDMSSADRMGAVYDEPRFGAIPLVVIDHHITNTNFGVANWVEPRCAATAQMLVVLSGPLGIEVDTRLA
ncbi:MAG: DHH family phosphoesterase, partial [Caldilinea sp.]|nr:DHH family phosphoesterase [Caldilinea sp.]